MEIPSYLSPRPAYELTSSMRQAFDELFSATPPGSFIDYQLPYPRWQFLSYLCDSKDLILHGSRNHEILEVKPQQAHDVRDFSAQQAIYATTDGIWSIFFAIIDRSIQPMSLFNSCLQARISPGMLSDPLYFFSIPGVTLAKKPFIEGMIYLLPRQSFIQEESSLYQGVEIVFPHWISSQAVFPIAKLKVSPQDFPFLQQIRGHDLEKLNQLITQYPDDFSMWMAALEG